MYNRPPINKRVRTLANLDVPNWIDRVGTVVAHHEDGIAFEVQLDGGDDTIICDPINVDPVRESSSDSIQEGA